MLLTARTWGGSTETPSIAPPLRDPGPTAITADPDGCDPQGETPSGPAAERRLPTTGQRRRPALASPGSTSVTTSLSRLPHPTGNDRPVHGRPGRPAASGPATAAPAARGRALVRPRAAPVVVPAEQQRAGSGRGARDRAVDRLARSAGHVFLPPPLRGPAGVVQPLEDATLCADRRPAPPAFRPAPFRVVPAPPPSCGACPTPATPSGDARAISIPLRVRRHHPVPGRPRRRETEPWCPGPETPVSSAFSEGFTRAGGK